MGTEGGGGSDRWGRHAGGKLKVSAMNAASANDTFLMYSHGIMGAVRSCDKVDEGKILGRGAERLMRARGAQLG